MTAFRQAPGCSAALLAGAAGALGSAVLERLLGGGTFARVQVLVAAPIAPALRGFEPLPVAALDAGSPLCADTGIVVFDRERDVHGREAALHRPAPAALPALARALQRGGVRRLIVVLPHAPALLPAAFKHGLASLDEQTVAALGFEQLVIVRSARMPSARRATAWPQRLADGVLAQLHWLVPQREQPVRVEQVAALVAALAARLPQAAPGTRIVPPELIWEAAQQREPGPLVERWLEQGQIPATRAPSGRW